MVRKVTLDTIVLGLVYWTDTGERKIQRAHRDGHDYQTVIGKGLHTVDGIVIDSAGHKVCNHVKIMCFKRRAIIFRKYINYC